MSRGQLKFHFAGTVGRRQDEEPVEEFSKQTTELKKNTNNKDLHKDKLSRDKKTCMYPGNS